MLLFNCTDAPDDVFTMAILLTKEKKCLFPKYIVSVLQLLF